MRRVSATIALLTSSASLLIGTSTAFAAQTWSGPKTLSDPNETVDFPRVALNGRGNAVAVWYQVNGEDLAMRGATRVPGEGFGSAVTLGPANQPSGNNPPTLPDVAIDRRGNAIASWLMRDADGNLRIVASFQPRNGGFGPPVTLSDPGQPAFNPQIAFDHRGRAIAVWERFDGADTRVQAAIKGAKQPGFGEAQTLSAEGLEGGVPQVGLSDSGQAVAIWLSEGNAPPFNHLVLAARAGKQGGFGQPQTVSSQDVDSDDPHLAVSRKGAAMATWTQSGPVTSDIGTAFAPQGGAFQPAVAIEPASGFSALLPRIAMDRRGRATLVWIQAPPEAEAGTNMLRATRTNVAGVLTGPQVLDTTENEFLQPALAVARAGNAVSAWVEVPTNPPFNLRAAARTRRGKQFGAAEAVSPEGVSAAVPSLGANRRLAIAVWEVSTGETGTAVIAQTYRRR